jgi:hypothetical protein
MYQEMYQGPDDFSGYPGKSAHAAPFALKSAFGTPQ